MKKLVSILLVTSILFVSCDKADDGEEMHTDYDYHVHIQNPVDSSTFMMGNPIAVEVDFESRSNETVHHVAVTIEKVDGTAIFHTEDHVHETSGKYTMELEIELTEAAGYESHKDYILEAKVWGHEDGESEVTETVGFHVHPM